jgi:hypothetical protein
MRIRPNALRMPWRYNWGPVFEVRILVFTPPEFVGLSRETWLSSEVNNAHFKRAR